MFRRLFGSSADASDKTVSQGKGAKETKPVTIHADTRCTPEHCQVDAETTALEVAITCEEAKSAIDIDELGCHQPHASDCPASEKRCRMIRSESIEAEAQEQSLASGQGKAEACDVLLDVLRKLQQAQAVEEKEAYSQLSKVVAGGNGDLDDLFDTTVARDARVKQLSAGINDMSASIEDTIVKVQRKRVRSSETTRRMQKEIHDLTQALEMLREDNEKQKEEIAQFRADNDAINRKLLRVMLCKELAEAAIMQLRCQVETLQEKGEESNRDLRVLKSAHEQALKEARKMEAELRVHIAYLEEACESVNDDQEKIELGKEVSTLCLTLRSNVHEIARLRGITVEKDRTINALLKKLERQPPSRRSPERREQSTRRSRSRKSSTIPPTPSSARTKRGKGSGLHLGAVHTKTESTMNEQQTDTRRVVYRAGQSASSEGGMELRPLKKRRTSRL